MRIEGLRKYRGRNPYGYFQHLPWDVRRRAYEWLHRLCEPWGSNLPRWRRAILIGQAKRLALTTPESRRHWSCVMRAKLGGYRVQQRYRMEGRIGKKHPAHKAARVSVWRRKSRKEEKDRQKLGLPPKTRSKWLPIG